MRPSTGRASCGAGVGEARQRRGVGAHGARIERPGGRDQRPQPGPDGVAEDAGQFVAGMGEEGGGAAALQFAGDQAAEIAFDDRPAERAQVIGADRRAVGAAIDLPLDREDFRAVERHEELVGEAERQPGGRRQGVGQGRVEDDPARQQDRRRQRHDHPAGPQRAVRGLDPDVGAGMVDPGDRAVEGDRQARRMGGDQRAVAGRHPPVHRRLVVAPMVEGGDPVGLDPVGPGAAGRDQRVPGRGRVGEIRGRPVLPRLGRGVDPLPEGVALGPEGGLPPLLPEGAVAGRAAPGRGSAVDGEAEFVRHRDERVAIGRVQPVAAEVERVGPVRGRRPGAPADPATGLQDAERAPRFGQPPARPHAGGTRPDDDHIDIPLAHRALPSRRPPRADTVIPELASQSALSGRGRARNRSNVAKVGTVPA
jgi:hypothetical protein